MLQLDLHVHTSHSYDGAGPVRAVLAAARDAGLDGLAVTDHDTAAGARRAVELAPEYGLFVLPGVEVSTRDGHLLGLGIDRAPPTGRPMAETVRAVREAGGVAVVPHPFQRSRHGAGRRAIRRADPDAIETFNAHLLTGLRNRRAARFAARTDRPAVGGSDAHRPGTVGRAHTVVRLPDGRPEEPADVPSEGVLDALRAGRTTAHGRRVPVRRGAGQLLHNATLRTGGGLARVRHLLAR